MEFLKRRTSQALIQNLKSESLQAMKEINCADKDLKQVRTRQHLMLAIIRELESRGEI